MSLLLVAARMDWFPVLIKGTKCKIGRALLESQMRLFNVDELHKDPFEISPKDMVNVIPTFNVIDIDEDEDIDIDWSLIDI